MGKGHEQGVFQSMTYKWPLTHEKILHITSHQDNNNNNNNLKTQ